MGGTLATTSGDRRAVTQAGFLSSLFPRFDAAVTPEFYRLTGKLRVITNSLFLIANFVIAPQLDALGFDPDVHWRGLFAFTAVHLADGVLGWWLWRGHLPARRMRRLTYASVAIETPAVLFASWMYGSVNSPFFGITLLFILIYRLGFDFRIGFVVFASIFAGLWLLVGLEVAGVLPPQPVAVLASDHVYERPARELAAMVNLSFVMVLTFAIASWAVGRIRHKDLAIRLLRESLHADKTKVGRQTGRTLRDTYALGAVLGSGGMGEVYAATHLRTQRRVAVKVVHPHLLDSPTVLSRFRREAMVTGQLGSEHIVGVIDVDEDDGQPFLVLELVEGDSLASRLAARGPLALGELVDVIDQVAAGLDVAHRAGVIHRDLKPENILLCPQRAGGVIVKILDFGVSKIRGDAAAITNVVAILGTPDFMSPEQALGHAEEVDATSDIFALGSVAYLCLTGHRPFHADSVPALLRQICDTEPAPIGQLRPEVPAAVADVIAIAMAKDRGQRYATASELARDLRAAIAGTLGASGARGQRPGSASAADRGSPGEVSGETQRS